MTGGFGGLGSPFGHYPFGFGGAAPEVTLAAAATVRVWTPWRLRVRPVRALYEQRARTRPPLRTVERVLR